MHLAKRLLTGFCAALAVLAGFVAAVVAIIGVAVFMVLRLFGKSSARRTAAPARRAAPWMQRRDAIDVTAVEVRSTESEPEPEAESTRR